MSAFIDTPLGGVVDRVMFVARLPGGDYGSCSAPGEKRPLIRVSRARNRDDHALLGTLIHEALHACDWSKNEEWVEQCSEEIADLLHAAGFRRDEEEAEFA